MTGRRPRRRLAPSGRGSTETRRRSSPAAATRAAGRAARVRPSSRLTLRPPLSRAHGRAQALTMRSFTRQPQLRRPTRRPALSCQRMQARRPARTTEAPARPTRGRRASAGGSTSRRRAPTSSAPSPVRPPSSRTPLRSRLGLLTLLSRSPPGQPSSCSSSRRPTTLSGSTRTSLRCSQRRSSSCTSSSSSCSRPGSSSCLTCSRSPSSASWRAYLVALGLLKDPRLTRAPSRPPSPGAPCQLPRVLGRQPRARALLPAVADRRPGRAVGRGRVREGSRCGPSGRRGRVDRGEQAAQRRARARCCRYAARAQGRRYI